MGEWGALWGLGFDGVHPGLLWPGSDPLDGVEGPNDLLTISAWVSIHFTAGHRVTLGLMGEWLRAMSFR